MSTGKRPAKFYQWIVGIHCNSCPFAITPEYLDGRTLFVQEYDASKKMWMISTKTRRLRPNELDITSLVGFLTCDGWLKFECARCLGDEAYR